MFVTETYWGHLQEIHGHGMMMQQDVVIVVSNGYLFLKACISSILSAVNPVIQNFYLWVGADTSHRQTILV